MINCNFKLTGQEFKLGRRPLVYAWIRDERYLYIGQTKVGMYRMLAHNIIDVKEPVHELDEFRIWYCELHELDELEKALIILYQPVYNVTNNRGDGKEQLCEQCNTAFIPQRSWQKYCSKSCKNYKKYRDE